MMLDGKKLIALMLKEYGDLDVAMDEGVDEGICYNCGHIQQLNQESSTQVCYVCEKDEVHGVEKTILTVF